MFDKLSQLEKLYGLRRFVLHRRVFPVVVFALLAVATGWLFQQGVVWAFDWAWFFVFLALVAFVWFVWPGHAFLRRKQLRQASLSIKHGDWSAAYKIYQNLNRLAVFPWEKASAQLDLAWFLYEAGNLKRTYVLANDLASRVADFSDANRVSWTILQTMQLEDAQAYDQALSCLDGLLESVDSPRLKMHIYNNRGRLYTRLNQLDFAQTEYEKAYVLFKLKPKKVWLSVIVHNVLLNYARQGFVEKAETLIDEYQGLLGKNKHEHWLEFSNDLLHAGREANHQAWIDRAYEIQRQIEPKNEDEAFVLGLTELRIRLNDGQAFKAHYESFVPKVKAKLEQGAFDLNQKLLIHRELMHVLHVKIPETSGADQWFNDFIWLTAQSKHWIPLVDDALAKVDTALPSEKVRWLKAKQRLLKDSIAFESNLTRLEQVLKEVVKIQTRVIDEWQSVDNVHQRVEEQIILLDDALSYTTQARSREEHAIMVAILQKPAENALDNLVDWALVLETYSGQENRIIFIAAALINMRHNTTLVGELMDKLHAEPFSLKHYALFVRDHYAQVMGVIERK